MNTRQGKAKGCMADAPWNSGKIFHRWIKRQKNRLERRRAKYDPQCVPGYKRYADYES